MHAKHRRQGKIGDAQAGDDYGAPRGILACAARSGAYQIMACSGAGAGMSAAPRRFRRCRPWRAAQPRRERDGRWVRFLTGRQPGSGTAWWQRRATTQFASNFPRVQISLISLLVYSISHDFFSSAQFLLECIRDAPETGQEYFFSYTLSIFTMYASLSI